MNLKDKIQKFNQRWNIKEKESYEESFNKFKTRILNIFEDIDHKVADESISLFCQIFGIKEEWEYGTMDNRYSENIINYLEQEENEIEFYKILEFIFALDIHSSMGYRHEIIYSKETIYRDVCRAIEFSNINLTTTQTKNGEIIFYPKGEKFLDNVIVNNTLSFLNKESSEHFEQSLKYYQSKKSVKSAESLRRANEEFLRHKLKNNKGLQVNIIELQKKLKDDNRDSQVKNIIFQTFSYLDQYFNENSKHNDGDIDNAENEFLIYQTALLMRYINQVI